MYINIETKEVISHTQLQIRFPETSFPPDGYIENSAITWTGYAVVELDPYPTLGELQTIIEGGVREEAGRYFQTWVVVLPTEPQWNVYNTEKLNTFLRQANAQINALQGRVDAINDAIEFDDATQSEIAELPVRVAQLKSWKQYRITLGRVNQQSGWASSPVWPPIPDAYTNEMSSVRPITV